MSTARVEGWRVGRDGHGQCSSTPLGAQIQSDFLVCRNLVLFELLCEARQTIVARCYQHLSSIFTLFLFQKETIRFISWLEDRHDAVLLLNLGSLDELLQLCRHLAQLSYSIFQD